MENEAWRLSERCKALAHPHWFPVALASCLIVGIVVSYLPQHGKILQRKSSEGLSPWWVLLGGLSSVAAIGNILTLPASRSDMACCKELSAGACGAAFLGVVQIASQWLCFMFIVLLYIVFFSDTASEVQDLSSSTASLTNSHPIKRRDPLIVGSLVFSSLLVVGIVSAVLVYAFPKHTQNWANFLGVVAGVLAAIQYVPQIYTTWRLKDAKSLSIATMCIQVPGALVFVASLWLRVGWEGWSTWTVYLVTAALQSCVLVLAIKYAVRSKHEANTLTNSSDMPSVEPYRHGNAVVEHGPSEASPPDERTALLSDQPNKHHV